MTNGFFGNITGPFNKNINIFTIIQEQCKDTIEYISKLGIHYIGNFDLDLNGNYCDVIEIKLGQTIVDPNTKQKITQYTIAQLGKTRMLELQDVSITSIQFLQDMDDRIFIDYQYVTIDK